MNAQAQTQPEKHIYQHYSQLTAKEEMANEIKNKETVQLKNSSF
jgi:hypothetical protein